MIRMIGLVFSTSVYPIYCGMIETHSDIKDVKLLAIKEYHTLSVYIRHVQNNTIKLSSCNQTKTKQDS